MDIQLDLLYEIMIFLWVLLGKLKEYLLE